MYVGEKVRTKSFTVFLILLLMTIALAFNVQLARSDSAAESGCPVVRVIPEVVELGPKNVTGQTFSVAVVVENVILLGGVDIMFRYDPAYLDYANHIVTAYIEEFPDPVPPSPYGGCLHEPKLMLINDVDTEAGTYHAAMATLGGPSFNGSGTVFVMTFRVRSQPAPGEEDTVMSLDIPQADLGQNLPIEPTPPTIINGTVIIHALALHELTVTTSPFLTIPFTVDGESRTTPYTQILDEDFHTIEMPGIHAYGFYPRYVWSRWLEDGDTNRTKTIMLNTNTTLTALYMRERAVLRVIPEVVELGPEHVIGNQFTVAVVIENVVGLSGFELRFGWNSTYLDYVNHTLTAPVEDYPLIQLPSPYPGIIHKPSWTFEDEVDSTGTYWVAICTLGGPYFNGSGTAFTMTFEVAYQPEPVEEDVVTRLRFLSTDLAGGPRSEPIPRDILEGIVIIYALTPPPSPPIGGFSISVESGQFSSWLATTLLIEAFFFASAIQFRRKNVRAN